MYLETPKPWNRRARRLTKPGVVQDHGAPLREQHLQGIDAERRAREEAAARAHEEEADGREREADGPEALGMVKVVRRCNRERVLVGYRSEAAGGMMALDATNFLEEKRGYIRSAVRHRARPTREPSNESSEGQPRKMKRG